MSRFNQLKLPTYRQFPRIYFSFRYIFTSGYDLMISNELLSNKDFPKYNLNRYPTFLEAIQNLLLKTKPQSATPTYLDTLKGPLSVYQKQLVLAIETLLLNLSLQETRSSLTQLPPIDVKISGSKESPYPYLLTIHDKNYTFRTIEELLHFLAYNKPIRDLTNYDIFNSIAHIIDPNVGRINLNMRLDGALSETEKNVLLEFANLLNASNKRFTKLSLARL